MSSTHIATRTFLDSGFGVIFVVVGKIKFSVEYKLFEERNSCFKYPVEVMQFRGSPLMESLERESELLENSQLR